MTASSEIFVAGRDAVPSAVRLEQGESLRWTIVVPPGVSSSIAVEIDLDGPGCTVDIAGLYLCKADEKVRINVLLRHNNGGCESHQLFKGVVGGSAVAEFDGLIYVKEGAQRTKAFQESHSILLSREARAESRPQLEIYADDVECSHGATTGFLDPEQEFYLRSRGVEKDEARRLQIQAFVAPVLQRLPEELQEEIAAML